MRDDQGDALFDVIEGTGAFEVGERRFEGGPGKCVFVPAGTNHSLHNLSDTAWIVRVTHHEEVTLRHVGRILLRTVRRRLRLPE